MRFVHLLGEQKDSEVCIAIFGSAKEIVTKVHDFIGEKSLPAAEFSAKNLPNNTFLSNISVPGDDDRSEASRHTA